MDRVRGVGYQHWLNRQYNRAAIATLPTAVVAGAKKTDTVAHSWTGQHKAMHIKSDQTIYSIKSSFLLPVHWTSGSN